MKYQQLKKRLLAESGIIAGSLAVLGAAVFFLSDFSDNYKKGSDALENKVNGIAAETTALHSKYDKIQQNNALYEKIIQLQSQDGFTISPQVAKNRFNDLRDRYFLNNLHLNMSPIKDMQGANYQRSTHGVVSSDVSIDFEGLSDEYAYSVLNAIQQELPGSSKIVTLTLTRQGNVTDEALRAISEKGAYSLIKGEIKFTWFGITSVDSSDSTNASKNKK